MEYFDYKIGMIIYLETRGLKWDYFGQVWIYIL